jgi:DNA-binding protein HU-alpha
MAKKAMTKSEVVEAIAAGAQLSKKQAAAALDALVGAISGALAKGRAVQLMGLGTFSTARRKKRTARNPRTGELITVPARTVPVFRAATALRKAVSK